MADYKIKILSDKDTEHFTCAPCLHTYGFTIRATYVVQGGVIDPNQIRGFCTAHAAELIETLKDDDGDITYVKDL